MFAIVLLQLSIGLGYDLEDDYDHQSKDFKGIFHIESDNGKYGFWHSSRINNGFKSNEDDQNIFYIKIRIK